MNTVQSHQIDKFVNATKGSPLFLELLDPILRQGRKSVGKVIVRLALTPKKSKWRKMPQRSHSILGKMVRHGSDIGSERNIRHTFHLKFKGLCSGDFLVSQPFSVKTTAKVLFIEQSVAIVQLEGLVASRIILQLMKKQTKGSITFIHSYRSMLKVSRVRKTFLLFTQGQKHAL